MMKVNIKELRHKLNSLNYCRFSLWNWGDFSFYGCRILSTVEYEQDYTFDAPAVPSPLSLTYFLLCHNKLNDRRGFCIRTEASMQDVKSCKTTEYKSTDSPFSPLLIVMYCVKVSLWTVKIFLAHNTKEKVVVGNLCISLIHSLD